MQYIGIERATYGEYGEDQWICRIPQSAEKVKELIEVGFEYVSEIRETDVQEAQVNASSKRYEGCLRLL
jgi:hypothetical protein